VPVSTEGQEHVPSVVGPLARSLDTLHLLIKETIKAEPWKYDTKVHPIPWRQEHYDEMLSRPLVIGILLDDGVVKVHPPIERVLREVREKLETAGHEVVDWDASGHAECIRIMANLFMHKPDHHLTNSPAGPVLPRRQRRRHPQRYSYRRRAFHSTRRSSPRSSRSSTIPVYIRLLAAQSRETRRSTSPAQKVDGILQSIRSRY